MMGDIELQFDVISYTLIALLVGLLVIPVVLGKDPDIHPFALLRQSSVAPVRNPKESAVYRSLHTPPGYPLVSGLGLPAKEKYSNRSGDIRDIWKLAIEKGKGKLLSVKGKDLVEHDMNKLTNDIYSLGSHLHHAGAKRVAIYLPNDVENLVASFACAFYNITLIVLPFERSGVPDLSTLIRRTAPDILIAQAGQFPLAEIEEIELKEVVYVVEEASRHLDWTSSEDSKQKSVEYHEIVKSDVESTDPDVVINLDAPAVVIFGPKITDKIEIVEFSQRNIIAGVAAQSQVLPKSEQYNPTDVFVPVDSLADLYTRIHTYVALSAGSTVALSSIGGKHADLEKAVRNVNPTIIVSSPESLLELHRKTRGTMMEMWHGLIHFFQTRTLVNGGRIPQGNFFTRVNDYIRPEVGPNLRLVFVAESGGDPNSQALNSLDLCDLRTFFKSRVVYGLKHHKVAGPVTQCNVFDYRVKMPEKLPNRSKRISRKCAHFGGVTPAIEIKLRDVDNYTADSKDGPQGEVVVAGFAVSGGKETGLGFVGKWEPEGVLSYA
ncbi:hypothetical protein EDC01DRAFT_667362 [Geopyxis carbonaria]|nr:hypothetical protein EDC01DRAFT_667362 [Geopyxis carbonaria]